MPVIYIKYKKKHEALKVVQLQKEEIIQQFGAKEKVIGYNWLLPEINLQFGIAIGIMLVGVIVIWLMEKMAEKKE